MYIPAVGMRCFRMSMCWLSGKVCAVVCIYHHGVGRLRVAYPQVGAMREPDFRDKHAKDFTPTSFLFP